MPLCERCRGLRATSEVQRAYRYEATRKVVEVQVAVVIAGSSEQAVQLASEEKWDVATSKPERARARRADGEPAGWVCRDQESCLRRRRTLKDAEGNYVATPATFSVVQRGR